MTTSLSSSHPRLSPAVTNTAHTVAMSDLQSTAADRVEQHDGTTPDTTGHAGCACCTSRARRDVLAMAGLGVVGTGLLAACGADGSSTGAGAAPSSGAATPTSATPTSATPSAATSAAPTSAAATSAAPSTAPTSATPTKAAGRFTVAKSAVPVGGGTISDAAKIVVTQPTAGTFKAFTAVCPHQGCTVSAVEEGEIQCPCHASKFDVATGAVRSGPARSGLTAQPFTVSGADIVVT